jgi:hypothetical protein
MNALLLLKSPLPGEIIHLLIFFCVHEDYVGLRGASNTYKKSCFKNVPHFKLLNIFLMADVNMFAYGVGTA